MNQQSRSQMWRVGGSALLLAVAGVGCSNMNNCASMAPASGPAVARASDYATVIRAQNADRPKPSHNTKLVTHEGQIVDTNTMNGPYAPGRPMVAGGPAACPPEYAGGNCPPGYGYGQACPPGYGEACPPGYGGNCWNQHTYSYKNPGVPVYPAGTGPGLSGPGSPGAIIQYPYYTTKGPDDFFLDEDGKY